MDNCFSCDLSILSDPFRLGVYRFEDFSRRRTFERQSVANFSYDTLLQRLDEVRAGVSACDFRSLQVERRQFTRPRERLATWHNLGNHSPFVRGVRRQRLWIQQECLRPSCPGLVAPRGKDSVARHNATGEMRQIMEGRSFSGHNHVREQRVFGMHVSASRYRGNHRHTNVGQILENLNTLIMHLAPNTRIRDVAERREIDPWDELPSCTSEVHGLVRPILAYP